MGLALFTAVAQANKLSVDFYRQELEDLSSFSTYSTENLRGRISLWVLFQPDCASCKRQLDDLGCLPPAVEKVALGIRGVREKLNRALRPAEFRGRKFVASPSLERELGTQATPTLFFVDAGGRNFKTFTGTMSCAKILDAITLHLPVK